MEYLQGQIQKGSFAKSFQNVVRGYLFFLNFSSYRGGAKKFQENEQNNRQSISHIFPGYNADYVIADKDLFIRGSLTCDMIANIEI